MKILAIETSCDETAIALLNITGPREKPEIQVLANSLLSQIHIHQEYGGVYPQLAKREHEKNLPILLSQTLKEAHESEDAPDIDYIAVTSGPGLEPALWTGINFAEELAQKWSKPLLPINHMEGHIFSVLYNAPRPLEFPALALLVSGGHTELVRVSNFGEFEILGRTKDDAVGEAFDKVARMLGLPYPGGPEISKLANEARKKGIEPRFILPRPMMNSGNLDFSFSGLKTAVLYKLRDLNIEDKNTKLEFALAFEDACVDVLTEKTRRALESESMKALIVAGGVSANSRLRESLESLSLKMGVPILLPEKMLSTDNAIMIGIVAFLKTKDGLMSPSSSPITAKGNLSLRD